MASIAGQVLRDLVRFDFRRIVAAWAADRSSNKIGMNLLPHERLTVRAVAGAGLAALLALPFLLLTSVVFAAPLAVPAAIGLGYLAVSHALASHHLRRATFITGIVLCGLVGWLLLFLLIGDRQYSQAGLTAALMAPLFAAAPAFARTLITAGTARTAIRRPVIRDAALTRVACLDELTPSEQVLILNTEGDVLAATSAARGRLGMLPNAVEHHLNSLFTTNDLLLLLDAFDRCKGRAEPASVELGGRGGQDRPGERILTTFSVCGDGLVAMRLVERPAIARRNVTPKETTAPTPIRVRDAMPARTCDIGEALAFALRHSGPKAKAKNVGLTSAVEGDIAAACDRQVGRRILHLLVDNALNGSSQGGSVRIVARRLRGVVLLRVASEDGAGAGDDSAQSDDRLDLEILRATVESVGGTLVVGREGNDVVLSVRLALAAESVPRADEFAEAV